ncbi:Flp family type IVb pilin [Shinella zoogloeoides]|uniref:Flp family type IVb pilin n=2 Tax=Shinella zoogloeoides TaxID=352475 RepID=A0A6N8TJZ7_SHIZO|nr:Flp family type IVb pilin [Shinella zoogloeoides]
MRFLKSFLADAKGATAIEYGLMAALVAVGLIVGLSALGDSLDNTFQMLSESLTLED